MDDGKMNIQCDMASAEDRDKSNRKSMANS